MEETVKIWFDLYILECTKNVCILGDCVACQYINYTIPLNDCPTVEPVTCPTIVTIPTVKYVTDVYVPDSIVELMENVTPTVAGMEQCIKICSVKCKFLFRQQAIQ